MVKSSFEINMNYNQAIRQAEALNEIARELRDTANQNFQECTAELSYSWSGSNSETFIRKCNLVKAEILSSADKIENIADKIRKIARNTYNAEMKTLEIALSRKY